MAYEALLTSNKVYGKELQRKLKKYAGISAETLVQCVGSSNDTVQDCPQKDEEVSSFIMVAHN